MSTDKTNPEKRRGIFHKAMTTPPEGRSAYRHPALPCDLAAEGYFCTRARGHDGPCAAHPVPKEPAPQCPIQALGDYPCQLPKGHDGTCLRHVPAQPKEPEAIRGTIMGHQVQISTTSPEEAELIKTAINANPALAAKIAATVNGSKGLKLPPDPDAGAVAAFKLPMEMEALQTVLDVAALTHGDGLQVAIVGEWIKISKSA